MYVMLCKDCLHLTNHGYNAFVDNNIAFNLIQCIPMDKHNIIDSLFIFLYVGT